MQLSMPVENTHMWMARELIKELPKPTQKLIKKHEKLFYLGSVTPDAFFYLSKTREFGSKLHGKNGELTNKIIFEQLKEEKEEDLVFTLGYITHCALDIVFHPMAFYWGGNYNDPKTHEEAVYRHLYFETYLDKYFNKDFFLQYEICLECLDKINTERFPGFRKALKRQIQIHKMIMTKRWYYLAKVLVFFRIIKKRVLALFYVAQKEQKNNFTEYRHPVTGREVMKSFDQLMDEAKILAKKMIIAALKYKQGKISKKEAEKFITGASLETGFVKKGVLSMSYFVNIK